MITWYDRLIMGMALIIVILVTMFMIHKFIHCGCKHKPVKIDWKKVTQQVNEEKARANQTNRTNQINGIKK